MPIHDWSRVDHGIFHHFHQAWTIEISNALNSGGLPPGFFALAEQFISGPIPDVVTLQKQSPESAPSAQGQTPAIEFPPRARIVTSATLDHFVRKTNHLVIRHQLGQVVAVVEIVSPGNKSSKHALRQFVEKAYELLRQGIHLLVVDLFPPSVRDPQGIHKAIWDEIVEEPFSLPADKPLTVAAYWAGDPKTAYVEPIAVGDRLPDSPIFLDLGTYVPTPLEATYQATWDKCPDALREVVESPGA
ncbi:MAG TPA: DUF4058 family protein [Pirellulaceae bacterium]|nr:DUF4058 family protein [Pirellulaceae bacterium]